MGSPVMPLHAEAVQRHTKDKQETNQRQARDKLRHVVPKRVPQWSPKGPQWVPRWSPNDAITCKGNPETNQRQTRDKPKTSQGQAAPCGPHTGPPVVPKGSPMGSPVVPK